MISSLSVYLSLYVTIQNKQPVMFLTLNDLSDKSHFARYLPIPTYLNIIVLIYPDIACIVTFI